MNKFADLAQLATRAQKLADGCNLHAEPGQPDNPWVVIGGLRHLTGELVRQIEQQAAIEEQERFEAQEQRAVVRQMSEQRRRNRDRDECEYAVRARGEI